MNPEDFAEKYDTQLSATKAAFENIKTGEAIALAVSGKLGAGKDTAAPLVMDGLGAVNRFQEVFAKPLKDEITFLIKKMMESNDKSEIIRINAAHMKAPQDQVALVVNRLWNDVKTGKVKSSYDRTADSRFAVQYWGTEVRRNQDLNYWVKRAIKPSIEQLANGVSVFVTDARFENEIDSLVSLGAFTLRLKVSREKQIERIIARDGSPPTEEALMHISEISLDNYENAQRFTAIVDTDNLSASQVVDEAVKLLSANKAGDKA